MVRINAAGWIAQMADKSKQYASSHGKEGATDRDRLEYIADLLLELQSIAKGTGCETLAGLLSLSHAEAVRKAGRGSE